MKILSASQSVRPVANIDSKSHVNPSVLGGDYQDDLYDKLLQPFDDSADCESHADSSACLANHDHDAHSASGEAVAARIANAPKKPSQAEVDTHMATHLPFRSWCPHCVRGKAKGKPHARNKAEKEIPTE